jgi:hypothetical protein
VEISAEEMSSKNVLVWKFASHGDPLSLCIFYGNNNCNVVDEDPYNHQKPKKDPYNNSIQENMVSSDMIINDTTSIAMYRTMFHFPSNVADRLETFVYGHILLEELIPAASSSSSSSSSSSKEEEEEEKEKDTMVLTFEWDNRESAEVISKHFCFSIKCIPFDQIKEVLKQDYIQLVLDNLSTSLEDLSTLSQTSITDSQIKEEEEVQSIDTFNSQKKFELLVKRMVSMLKYNSD